jgi:hypothetical protein
MQLFDDWQTDVTYSFDSTVPAILPTRYTQVKLEGVTTFEIAKIIEGPNAYSMWRRIYPSLTDVTDDPAAVKWLLFRASNGERITLANPWILSSSVTPVNFIQQRIILTQTSDAQVAKVTAFLDAIQAKYTSERIVT